MQDLIKRLLGLSLLLSLASCTPTPQPIQYGVDSCAFCKMSIVDQQHAAEMVTQKGKVYKYDAIECLIQAIQDREKATVALLLVNDYAQPGVLIDATQGHFLISEQIPSPMGAYLSAFSTEAMAKATQKQQGGQLFNWETIQKQITRSPGYSAE